MNSFKNRKIDYDKPVYIYRCLNRKGHIYSIKQNGVVVAHTEKFIVKNCNLVINKSGKERVIKEKIRNVHAFIKGYLGDIDDVKNSFSWILKYNPFVNKGFTFGEDKEVKKCEIVYTQENKLLIQI